MNRAIVGELFRASVLLGADRGILSAVGSWGDSLPDEDVLANLRAWNDKALAEIKSRTEPYKIAFLR